MQCNVMWCDVMQCDVVWCNVMCYNAMYSMYTFWEDGDLNTAPKLEVQFGADQQTWDNRWT